MIPYGKQDINQHDIDSVIEVLKSDFLTQGPRVPEFEKVLSSFSKVNHALAFNSATSALHIACLALELGEGDLLWTSPITFVASANCGLYCGAKIDFVDIDPKTYNMCPKKLEEKLIYAKAKNELPKIVIPVHLSGQSCDMESIQKLSKKFGFKVIEDASHAIGGKFKDSPIGSCKYSDITVFSFHPVKIVTTAEGGAALTNSNGLAKKMEILRTHGITRDPAQMIGKIHGDWYYQQIDLGFNYRMTEIQAALGISQMKRLKDFVRKRNVLASRYNKLLKDLPLKLPHQLKHSYSSMHLYIIRLKIDEIKMSHKEIFNKLRFAGVGVNLHYIPVHFHPYYKELGFKEGVFEESESYYKEAISLPLFHSMTIEEQDHVIDSLHKILQG